MIMNELSWTTSDIFFFRIPLGVMKTNRSGVKMAVRKLGLD